MIYSNNDPMAISAMEIARTGNYGEYDYDDSPIICPICTKRQKYYIRTYSIMRLLDVMNV